MAYVVRIFFLYVYLIHCLVDENKIKKNPGNLNPSNSSFPNGIIFRSTSGITCGSGSFAVQFGDHFRFGDHLWRCTVIYIFFFFFNLRALLKGKFTHALSSIFNGSNKECMVRVTN